MPTVTDVRAHLLAQDVVRVGGGSVADLLAVWRVHGLGDVFREAWEAGVVLAGVSAGSPCWHTGGSTDSDGPDLRPVTDGLGLIPTSNGVHYDSEGQRRPLYHRLGADGRCPGGMPPTTAPASSTGAPTWWRPSPTARRLRPTGPSAARTGPRSRAAWRPAGWPDPGAYLALTGQGPPHERAEPEGDRGRAGAGWTSRPAPRSPRRRSRRRRSPRTATATSDRRASRPGLTLEP